MPLYEYETMGRAGLRKRVRKYSLKGFRGEATKFLKIVSGILHNKPLPRFR